VSASQGADAAAVSILFIAQKISPASRHYYLRLLMPNLAAFLSQYPIEFPGYKRKTASLKTQNDQEHCADYLLSVNLQDFTAFQRALKTWKWRQPLFLCRPARRNMSAGNGTSPGRAA
jgi:hypothetical protein